MPRTANHSTHTYLVQKKRAHVIRVHTGAVRGCHKGKSSQSGCCCTVTATSTALESVCSPRVQLTQRLQNRTVVGARCARFTADHSTRKSDYSRPLEKRGSRFTAHPSRGLFYLSGLFDLGKLLQIQSFLGSQTVGRTQCGSCLVPAA